MKINYRLEKKNKLDKTGNIRLDSHYNGKRFRYFIGIHLEKKLWSCNKQRLKSSAANSSSFNQRLNDIKIGLEKTERPIFLCRTDERTDGHPTTPLGKPVNLQSVTQIK